MLYLAFLFLVIAIAFGALAFGDISSSAAGIAQAIFVVVLIAFVASLIVGLVRRRLGGWVRPRRQGFRDSALAARHQDG